MKIAIANDHAGYELKVQVIDYLKEQGHQILDFGGFSTKSVDYPDYAFPASEAVASGVADFGVLICGSGVGMSIIANKVTGIRASNCYSAEIAKLSRQHNNANIICMGARFIPIELAKEMIEVFFSEDFEGGRHMIRVEKIHNLTSW
jgi:ribose 5-phosphate isomerase B